MDQDVLEEAAELFNALGHPIRLAVLLAVEEDEALARVAEEYDVTRSTVQDHVEVLVDTGLVERTGGHRYRLTQTGSDWIGFVQNPLFFG